MTAGKPFIPDADDFKSIAYEAHGNVVKIAKHFNVHKDTIYQYLHRHDNMKLLDEIRNRSHCTFLDMAEHVNLYNLANYSDNPGLAQRAAEFTIERLGYLRGWSYDPSSETVPKNDDSLSLGHENMMLRAQLAALKEKNDNKSEAR